MVLFPLASWRASLVVLVVLPSCGISQGDEEWRDTPDTTRLWETISRKDSEGLMDLLIRSKNLGQKLAVARSADGRGGSWWAWEYGNSQALAILQAFGDDVWKIDEDTKGSTPISMCESSGEDCKALGEKVTAAVEGVKKEIEEREKKQKELEDAEVESDTDDDDYDDDEF